MLYNFNKCDTDVPTRNKSAYIVCEFDSLFALSITPAGLHGFAGFLTNVLQMLYMGNLK